jgi:cellobiose-specific phosphotransferase system component IIA
MDWWSIALNALSLVLVVVQGLLAWGLWSLRKQFVGQEQCGARCQAMAQTQAQLAQDQAKLEQAQKALPTAAEVQGMQVQLTEIEGNVKVVMATMQGQAELMQRIERPLNLLLEHHLRRNGE